MAPVTIKIVSKSGRLLTNVQIEPQATVRDLKQRLKQILKKGIERQRLVIPSSSPSEKPEVLKDDDSLAKYKLEEGSSVQFKDLGPQVGYSTVFFWEYFGPLAVYPLFFFFPQVFYAYLGGVPSEKSLVQKLALAYWSLHYTKRILETFLVHRFSHDTMPIANLFRNCAYYWGFAAYVSFFVNHPLYTAPLEAQTFVFLALGLLCQVSNLYCHILQRNLRKPGEKGYKIPRGFLFNVVTCANYTAEIYGWIFFSIATQTVAAAIFTAAGAFQMIQWALQKHARLRKMFNGKDGAPKYPRRWVVLPPFL